MYLDSRNILETLVRRINSFSEGYRQNIAIIGEPYSGKTAIIKELLSKDSFNKDNIIPIYLEIKFEPFEFCAKRFIKSVISQLVKQDAVLTAQKDTVMLIEDLRMNYPKTAQLFMRVLQDIEKNRCDNVFSFMLDIPMMLSEETGKRCVFIIEEFQNMGNFPLKTPFSILAKKIMIQKDTMYFLLSSKITYSQNILSEKLSLLFGNFEKIFIGPFDISTSRLFLRSNITCMQLPQVYIDFIAYFTGNRPFYMEAICDEIERQVFLKKTPQNDYNKLIENSFTETIFKKRGMLNQHFLNFLLKISDCKLISNIITVLLAISSENKKQKDIMKSSKVQAKDISGILNLLIDADILVRNGVFYRFKDRLLNFWLKTVYLNRLLSYSVDEEVEETIFRKEMRNKLGIFTEESKKEFDLRLIELFKLFKSDIIQLNGKKHKFVSFTEIQKSGSEIENDVHLLASNTKNKWLCTIKKQDITENDIIEILKHTKERHLINKSNRNIVIAHRGIEENAYLLAKESKVWTWSIDDLNVLMEIYGKPYIVINEKTNA